MKIDLDGCAYPAHLKLPSGQIEFHYGLTAREKFYLDCARTAMGAIIKQCVGTDQLVCNSSPYASDIAAWAFGQADAMVAEAERRAAEDEQAT